MKKILKVCLAIICCVILLFPVTYVSAVEDFIAPQDVFKIAQKKIEKKGKKTEPEEWNRPEIKSYRFDSAIDALKYMLTGGMKYYNENFFKENNKIKVTVVESGTLFLSVSYENQGRTALYNKDMKFMGNIPEDTGTYIEVDAKAGDVFYVEMPSHTKEAFVMTYTLKNDFYTLTDDSIHLQKGKGTPTYHTFTLKKRSVAYMKLSPVTENGGTVVSYIQRRIKGKWVPIGKTYYTTAEDITICTYGLKAGTYRLILKAGTNQACTVEYINEPHKKSVTYSKSKAVNIRSRETKENVYTTGEKASRWYKIKVTSAKKRRAIVLNGDADNGKFKFTIYRYGRKKPVKTKTLTGDSTYSYKLPKTKATYYVKVSKVGKRTNGYYYVKFK